jgi:hypothetical protein
LDGLAFCFFNTFVFREREREKKGEIYINI